MINSLLEIQSKLLGTWRNNNRNSQKSKRVRGERLIKNKYGIIDPGENIKQFKINAIWDPDGKKN